MKFREVLTTLVIHFIIFSKSEIIEINDGKLKGTVMQSRKGVKYDAFLKIPFAEPPVGSLRFQPPIQNKKWEGILNATKFGPICMQFYYGSEHGISEDCLHLNVFTKNLNSNDLKPVMVYIHGGGFESGSASSADPYYFMDRDIVLVTINYRLGPFGFLAVGTKEATGNMGLKDQVLSLKWVQKNIAKFGGNPNEVTISGLSAGAYSVTAHMVSEMSKGLFHKVIALSGAITWQRELENNDLSIAQELAKDLNCSIIIPEIITCLQKKSAEEIKAVSARNFHDCPIMPWIPVLEPDFGQERFFTDEPNKLFKDGKFVRVPVIIGITADEFIEPVNSLLSNPESLKQLNENFTEIASRCFFFKGNKIKSVNEIATILRNYYLPFEKIEKRYFNNLQYLCADGTIGYAVHKFVHYVSELTDLYYYKFSYTGRHSLFNYPRDQPFGVHHVDDYQYLFVNTYIYPKINESDPENFMVERMTRIWEQFAKTGNPNNPSDEYLSKMIWPKHNNFDEYFLDIGTHMIEKQGLYLERYHVWNSLEISSSSRLNTNILIFISLIFMVYSLL